MKIDFIKKQYNFNLARYKKAERFFKDKKVEDCLNYLEELNQVIRKISNLQMIYFYESGQEMTTEQKNEGFKEVEE